MSEKIYLCLIRLFPAAFRRRYEKEALRLLRDWHNDERGSFRRLRLSFDLITDMVRALPQAYRNSYAEVGAAAPLTPHFYGIPSFRVLQKEPIQPGVIVLAGVLTFTAVAIFTYVMELAILYPPVERNGPKSPIEAVIEQLNQPISSDLAGDVRSDAEDTTRRGGQPISSTLHEQNPNTSYPERLRAVAATSSPSGGQQLMQSHPESIQIVVPSPTPSNPQSPAAVETNLSGRWTAFLPAAGRDTDIPRWFVFKQESAKLSGTGGPDSTEEYPIIDGSVAGDSVRFEMHHGRRRFLYDLKVKDKRLDGILSIRSANEMRAAKVWLERVH